MVFCILTRLRHLPVASFVRENLNNNLGESLIYLSNYHIFIKSNTRNNRVDGSASS